MTDEERQDQETPGYGDIAAELKKMGARLKEAFDAAMQADRSKEFQEQAQEVFDSLVKGAERLKQDAVSGELEKNARAGLYQTIKDLNRRLREYAESVRSKPKY